MTDLAPVLQGFFTDRLARQKKASPNTVPVCPARVVRVSSGVAAPPRASSCRS